MFTQCPAFDSLFVSKNFQTHSVRLYIPAFQTHGSASLRYTISDAKHCVTTDSPAWRDGMAFRDRTENDT
jgi:hypothetical protein